MILQESIVPGRLMRCHREGGWEGPEGGRARSSGAEHLIRGQKVYTVEAPARSDIADAGKAHARTGGRSREHEPRGAM